MTTEINVLALAAIDAIADGATREQFLKTIAPPSRSEAGRWYDQINESGDHLDDL